MAETNGLKKYLLAQAGWLTVVVLGQTGVLIWWASEISTRMTHVEQNVSKVEARLLTVEKDR